MFIQIFFLSTTEGEREEGGEYYISISGNIGGKKSTEVDDRVPCSCRQRGGGTTVVGVARWSWPNQTCPRWERGEKGRWGWGGGGVGGRSSGALTFSIFFL